MSPRLRSIIIVVVVVVIVVIIPIPVHALNGDVGDGIAPVELGGREVAETMDPGVDVYITLRAFWIPDTGLAARRPGDEITILVVALAS